MNLLILGGCFGVALIALILLVITINGEVRARNGSRAQASHSIEPEKAAPVAAPSLAAPQIPPVGRERAVPVQEEQHWSLLSNGHLRELSLELRALQEQAGDLEQRLQTITHLIEQLEQGHDGERKEQEEDALPPPVPSEDQPA